MNKNKINPKEENMPGKQSLAQRFAAHVFSTGLISPGMKLVIAVSGGADSVALLHLLQQLKAEMNLTLLAVHINHHLRGEASDEDEKFVKRLCNDLFINCIVKHIHFETEADLENQARIRRRKTLLQIMKSYNFDRIALAHQKNDQAETVLMNFARGSGITGMGGIKLENYPFIRPLLCFSKQELEEWLIANNWEWRVDKSNLSFRFTRNLIRYELIPWLENNVNKNVVDRLFLQAETFQKADAFLRAHTAPLRKKIVLEENPEQIFLDIELLRQLSEIEQYYILRNCYSQLSKTEQEFFRYSYEEIKAILTSSGSKIIRLAHNVWAVKQYNELILTTQNPLKEISEVKELVIKEKRSHLLFFNCRFTFRYFRHIPEEPVDLTTGYNALIDMNKVVPPLKLRGRQPGDRFQPVGTNYEKKLKEFFIDEKVPKFERDKVPILTDSEKIIWIVGYRLDRRAVCNGNTNRILMISAEPVNQSRKRAANRTFFINEEKHDIYNF